MKNNIPEYKNICLTCSKYIDCKLRGDNIMLACVSYEKSTEENDYSN